MLAFKANASKDSQEKYMGSSNCVELVLKCLRRNTFQRCKYLPIPNWQIIPRNVRNSMSMTSKLYAEIDKTVEYKNWNKQLKNTPARWIGCEKTNFFRDKFPILELFFLWSLWCQQHTSTKPQLLFQQYIAQVFFLVLELNWRNETSLSKPYIYIIGRAQL